LWGLNLFPIHSCELDTTKILCQVHLLSASSATYIFGRRHDQTCRSTIALLVHYPVCSDFQLRLFSVVTTTAPRLRLWNIVVHTLAS
jgi:hypothetical protein